MGGSRAAPWGGESLILKGPLLNVNGSAATKDKLNNFSESAGRRFLGTITSLLARLM